ncbi:MAG TPA: hypothetical protein VGS97_17920 [Actinocrinis sp.]|uniref:hypothetical protein n=1 Tax=Actinocrinis sp. TaxID=1920516 RepID=UPI002DDCC5E9|nr:hypothetical protein [Actinocrinis sp.]HEV2345982.1 hypothetical protein [Actinocrinis sp.]
MTGSYAAAFLIFLGLFLIGGVISFAKQGLPKVLTGLLGVCAALAIAAGVLRWK